MKKTEKNKNELFDVYPKIISRLLVNRGIKTKEEAVKFFEPKYEEGLHDPFLMRDMLKAVVRIVDAINNKERIVIYGDYDCDGIPAATIIYDFFKKIGFDNFEVYIPHRHEEGYGMNVEAVRALASRGADLVITVDSGITDFEAINEARDLGIYVIVTDHHEPKETLPEAYAVVNPKRKDDNYPYKMLSGSGVAFKLVQALISFGNFGISEGWEKWLLDLAGIGTIADMVPLDGENRVIAKYGLQVLKRTRRSGLRNLFRKLRIETNSISEEDVGFSIGPRINAASRMGVPMVAFKFMSSSDEEEALNALNYLEKKNNDRKKLVAEIMKEAVFMLEDKKNLDVLVLGKDEWMPGIAGLVANKLVEEHGKTTFVWGREGKGEIKGSCRSNGCVSLVDMMSLIDKEIISEFGGHHMAGGFSVAEGRISDFEKRINEAYLKTKKEAKDIKEDVWVDGKLVISEVGWELYDAMEKMAPFGVGNPRPVFVFEDFEVDGIRKFGKNKEHLEIVLKDEDNNKISAYDYYINEGSFEGVKIAKGERLSVIASIEKNNYGWKPSLRLRIVDVK